MERQKSLSSILLRRLLSFMLPAIFILASAWTIFEYLSFQDYAKTEEDSWIQEQRMVARHVLGGAFSFMETFSSYPSPFSAPYPGEGWKLLISYLDRVALDDTGFFMLLDAQGIPVYMPLEKPTLVPRKSELSPEKLRDVLSHERGMYLEISHSNPLSQTLEPAQVLVRAIPESKYFLARGFFLSGSTESMNNYRDWQNQLILRRLLIGAIIILVFLFLVLLYFRRLSGILAEQTNQVLAYLQASSDMSGSKGLESLWVPELRMISELGQSIMERERSAVHRQLEQESRYRSLFIASGESIILHSLDGRILEMNEQARLLISRMNLWAEGAVQRVIHVKDIFPPSQSETMDRQLDQLRRTSFSHWEGQVQAASGTMYVEMSSYAVDRDADLAQTLVRDVTGVVQNRQKIESLNRELTRLVDLHTVELDKSREELTRIQGELVQKEKLGLLVTVLASLGHEMETPLGIGVSLATMFIERSKELRRAQDNGDLTRGQFSEFMSNLEESSRILLDNMERAGDLMRNLKELAVDQATTVVRIFPVRDYLQKIILSMQPKISKTPHRLSMDCPGAVFVNGNPGSLYQIMVNLINNSLVHGFASGKPGRMRIAVEKSGTEILIRYMDDGAGIPEEIRERIFEPFFTTRRDSGGSGLGMHIIKSLVEKDFGGTVVLENMAEWSSCFLIRLPLADRTEE